MDDASRTSHVLNPAGVSQAEPVARVPTLPLENSQELILEPRLIIRYTHSELSSQSETLRNVQIQSSSESKSSVGISQAFDEAETIDCKSFEELLLHLENDMVEAIVFDSTVSQHECRYIMGWARIFKPNVRCQRVLPPVHLSKGRRSTEVA